MCDTGMSLWDRPRAEFINSGTLITNHTSIGENYKKIGEQFTKLFRKVREQVGLNNSVYIESISTSVRQRRHGRDGVHRGWVEPKRPFIRIHWVIKVYNALVGDVGLMLKMMKREKNTKQRLISSKLFSLYFNDEFI